MNPTLPRFHAAERAFPALAALLLATCAGPPAEERASGSMGELSKYLSDARPVEATQVDGSVPLERESFALADPALVELVEAGQDAQGQDGAEPPRQNPYIRFGERIIVRKGIGGEDFITKPYIMPISKAQKLVQLMAALEPFPFRLRPSGEAKGEEEPPLDPGILEYQVLKEWDNEFYARLEPAAPNQPPAVAATEVVLSDLLVVTASYPMLEEFEEFLDLFAVGGVPMIELEAKIIEIVETDQLDIGGSALLSFGDANFIQSLDINLPNVAEGAEAILSLGAVQNSMAFDAMIQAIRTMDNVQIESHPKTVVRAGGVAYIESTTEIPFSEIKTVSADSNFTATTVYKKVGVQMYISPRIVGTKMLALDVHLIGSQQVGSQATFSTTDGRLIEVPVIAYRTAKTLVYLEPGQTLLIGGLTSTRERELITKIPILGDIPLLGLLFRSTFTRTEKQHVLFAISPRILQHSDFVTEF